MEKFTKAAFPFTHNTLTQHYNEFEYSEITRDEYSDVWRDWLSNCQLKSINGLEQFEHADFVNGSSQTFDHFVLKHGARKTITNFIGDFQYHRCISKHIRHQDITIDDLKSKTYIPRALIISAPFSATGFIHNDFDEALTICNNWNIPVCLDLAYWGIARNIHIDLDRWPCVETVTSSLSKPFGILNKHRVGIRFSRTYEDDGVSMANEITMLNDYSMSLGKHFMQKYDSDYLWNQFGKTYSNICKANKIQETNSIIFGTSSDQKYKLYERGIPNVFRLGISAHF